MIEAYIELYKAKWNFFFQYGWKIALPIMVISVILFLIIIKKND